MTSRKGAVKDSAMAVVSSEARLGKDLSRVPTVMLAALFLPGCWTGGCRFSLVLGGRLPSVLSLLSPSQPEF